MVVHNTAKKPLSINCSEWKRDGKSYCLIEQIHSKSFFRARPREDKKSRRGGICRGVGPSRSPEAIQTKKCGRQNQREQLKNEECRSQRDTGGRKKKLCQQKGFRMVQQNPSKHGGAEGEPKSKGTTTRHQPNQEPLRTGREMSGPNPLRCAGKTQEGSEGRRSKSSSCP